MRIPLFRILAPTSLLLAVGAGIALAPHSGTEPSEPAARRPQPAASPTLQPVAPAPPPATGTPAAHVTADIWWNQPDLVTDLGLSTAQRQQMDQILFAYFRNHEVLETTQRNAYHAFVAGLSSGERDAARRAIKDLETSTSRLASAQARLMLDVVDLLSETQLARMRSQHAFLLRRQWILGMGGHRGKPARRRQRKGRLGSD